MFLTVHFRFSVPAHAEITLHRLARGYDAWRARLRVLQFRAGVPAVSRDAARAAISGQHRNADLCRRMCGDVRAGNRRGRRDLRADPQRSARADCLHGRHEVRGDVRF